MKQLVRLTILMIIVFISIYINAAAQENSNAFEVKITGQGKQVLIFIPGFACSGEVWDATKIQYEKNYTCYTLTMAGFAGVALQEKPSFKGWEDAIAAYIQQHKINKPVIIGHSMGGGLAMALAADYPDLVSKIVVVDALPCLAALMDSSFTSKENNDCGAIVAKITAATDEQFYQMQKQSMPRLLADTSKLALVTGWSVKSDRKTFAEMYCDFYNTDLREKIATVRCPALILLESYFVNLKPQINSEFKNLQNANLQYATKGLHFIMYDDTDWYNAQLKNFITQ